MGPLKKVGSRWVFENREGLLFDLLTDNERRSSVKTVLFEESGKWLLPKKTPQSTLTISL